MNPWERSPDALRRELAGLDVPDAVDPRDAWARAVWTVLAEPGDGAAGAAIAEVGAAAALSALVTASSDLPAEARARWMPRLQPAAVRAAFDAARRTGARLLVPDDPRWPGRVDDLGVHTPLALWTRGDLDVGGVPTVAIVGARAATAYGEGVTADLSAELAEAGVVVVSGAAYGIDGAAHRAALAGGAPTLAVLAGGVDRPYPRGHERLLERISEAGAVWSETPCGAAPTKWRFLSRNRIIAAVADVVVVVEAGWRSGSLNTAAHAATLGRSLGAVPGPITSAASAGCHRILRDYDGVCITSAADVLELLGTSAQRASRSSDPATLERTDDTTRVFDALSSRSARTTEEVARRSGLAVGEVQTLLGFAELDDRVVRDDEGRWRVRRRGV